GMRGQARVELQNSGDAADLAGIQTLVDDDFLSDDPAVVSARIELARKTAIVYAQANPVQGVPVNLDPNLSNAASGDIVFGHLDRPRSRVSTPTLSPGNDWGTKIKTVNPLRVRPRRSASIGNPVGSATSHFLMVPPTDVIAASTATLDRDVIGFRATPTQRIPLAPVALLSDPLGVNPLSWETQVEAGTGPDVFRFDRATKSYVAGTDGLHEMTVVLDPNGNGCVLRLGVSSVSDIATQVELGVTGADLGNGL